MKKTIKGYIETMLYISALIAIMCLPVMALAQLPTVGIGQTDINQTWQGATVTIPDLLMNASNWAIGIIALVSILIIVIAGFMWALAAGDEEKVKKARQWITGAVAGLVIALVAYAVVRVVLVYLLDIGA